MLDRLKKYLVFLFAIFVLSLTGCGGSFASVQPPKGEYPTASPYSDTEMYQTKSVQVGTFYNEVSFEALVDNSSKNCFRKYMSDVSDYPVGLKGTISFTLGSKTYTAEGEIIYNEDGLVSVRVLDASTYINYVTSIKFTATTERIENSVLVPKQCVSVLDSDGNALVYTVDGDGILHDVEIVIGKSNNDFYQVLEGLNGGEKVVVK